MTGCQTRLCKLIGAMENEDGLVLMANDQAGQLLRPTAKGRHQIQIIGAANCGRIGKEDDGQSGHWERKKSRRGVVPLSSSGAMLLPALETTQEKEASLPPNPPTLPSDILPP